MIEKKENQGEDIEDGTRIIYVPGANNHYKYEHDVIVLDERLKDYPKALRRIKEHELEHAKHAKPENRGFFQLIELELRTDIYRYFTQDEAMEEIRRYFREREKEQPISRLTLIKLDVAYFIRNLWNLVFDILDSIIESSRAILSLFD